jgi:hypothetical protein
VPVIAHPKILSPVLKCRTKKHFEAHLIRMRREEEQGLIGISRSIFRGQTTKKQY